MNKELQELQQQVYRRTQVLTIKQNLKMQIGDLKSKLELLQNIKEQEALDVERLERGGLRSFFADLSGRKADKLEKERQEAYEAAVKYQTAATELEVLEHDLAAFDRELQDLAGCEDRYKEALKAQETYYIENDPVKGPKIQEIEKQLVDLNCRRQEIKEALEAGERAEEQTQFVYQELEKAKNWSTIDLLGGGLITDLQKHSHMNAAQGEIEKLQVLLRRFKNELSDVETVMGDLKVNVEGFLKFADFFFDDIFSAWSVHGRIKDSNQKIIDIIQRIQNAMERLKSMLCQLSKQEHELEQELNRLITEE